MTDDVLDGAALRKLLNVIGGDPEDFDELKEEFLDSVPTTLAALQEGAASGNVDAMRIASHSLKGNARDFGALRLAELSAALEARCKDGEPGDIAGPVAEIAAAAQAAMDALAALEAADLA